MNALLFSRNAGVDFRAVLRSPLFWLLAAAALFMILGASPAYASDGGGTGLPWEGPIATLRKSVSGPVAFGIALLGIIACGATLIWGGEVSEFLRRVVYLVLVVCLIVFANSLLTGALFNGATIPANGLELDAHAAFGAMKAVAAR